MIRKIREGTSISIKEIQKAIRNNIDIYELIELVSDDLGENEVGGQITEAVIEYLERFLGEIK